MIEQPTHIIELLDDIDVNREAMGRFPQDKHQRRAALETEGAAGQFQHLQQG